MASCRQLFIKRNALSQAPQVALAAETAGVGTCMHARWLIMQQCWVASCAYENLKQALLTVLLDVLVDDWGLRPTWDTLHKGCALQQLGIGLISYSPETHAAKVSVSCIAASDTINFRLSTFSIHTTSWTYRYISYCTSSMHGSNYLPKKNWCKASTCCLPALSTMTVPYPPTTVLQCTCPGVVRQYCFDWTWSSCHTHVHLKFMTTIKASLLSESAALLRGWLFCILLSWPLCVWAYDLQYTHLISYTCSCMATYWPPMSQSCSQSAHRLSEQKRGKTKTTTPFGANWVRSQVLYRAAQALSEVQIIAQTAATCMRES